MKNKSFNFRFIILIVVICFIVGIAAIFFKTYIYKDKNIKKEYIGTWKFFAISIDAKYQGQKASKGEYIKIKRNSKAEIKIDTEIDNANWESIENGIRIWKDADISYDLYEKDVVLEFRKDNKTIYFKKDGADSKYIDFINKKIEDDAKIINQSDIGKIESNTQDYYGTWFNIAKEDNNKIIDTKEEKNTLEITDNKIIVEQNENKTLYNWTIDKDTKTIEIEYNDRKGIIFFKKDILVMITSDNIQYYTRKENIDKGIAYLLRGEQ